MFTFLRQFLARESAAVSPRAACSHRLRPQGSIYVMYALRDRVSCISRSENVRVRGQDVRGTWPGRAERLGVTLIILLARQRGLIHLDPGQRVFCLASRCGRVQRGC